MTSHQSFARQHSCAAFSFCVAMPPPTELVVLLYNVDLKSTSRPKREWRAGRCACGRCPCFRMPPVLPQRRYMDHLKYIVHEMAKKSTGSNSLCRGPSTTSSCRRIERRHCSGTPSSSLPSTPCIERLPSQVVPCGDFVSISKPALLPGPGPKTVFASARAEGTQGAICENGNSWRGAKNLL